MRPIVNMLEEHRATDMGNMHKKFGRDRACGSGDIQTDRQTDRQTHLSQYFATALAGDVINLYNVPPEQTFLQRDAKIGPVATV